MKRLFTALVAIGLMFPGVAGALTPNHHLRMNSTLPLESVIPSVAKAIVPVNYSEWAHVALCESGGWNVLGFAYPDSLGLTAQNWYAFGGGSDTSPEAQIAVAERFIAAYGISIPDQNGCAAW